MAIVWILGGAALSAPLLLVFFSNIYLELASRHARKRRLRATLKDRTLGRQEEAIVLESREAEACS